MATVAVVSMGHYVGGGCYPLCGGYRRGRYAIISNYSLRGYVRTEVVASAGDTLRPLYALWPLYAFRALGDIEAEYGR